MGIYSAVLQDEQADIGRSIVQKIATTRDISDIGINSLWREFTKSNVRLVHLVKKFELLEEVVATYYALRMIAPEVRKNVEAEVIRHLGRLHNLYEKYSKLVDAYGGNDWMVSAFTLMQLATMLYDNS